MQEADQEGLLKELTAVQRSLSALQKLLPGSTASDEAATQTGGVGQQAEQEGSSAMQSLTDDVADLVKVSCKHAQP